MKYMLFTLKTFFLREIVFVEKKMVIINKQSV